MNDDGAHTYTHTEFQTRQPTPETFFVNPTTGRAVFTSSGLTCIAPRTSVVPWSISTSGWSVPAAYECDARAGAGPDGRSRTEKENSGNKRGWIRAKYFYCRKAVHPVLHPRRGRRLRNNASWTVILAAALHDLRLDAQPFLRTFSSLPTRKYPWITSPRINQQTHCSKLFLSGTLGAYPASRSHDK